MSEPRVLLFDIETLPNLQEALKVWPQLSNWRGLTLRASINSVACFGYSVLGSNEYKCIHAWDYPEWEKDVNADQKLLLDIREIMSSADAVITHNGVNFDWRFLQTRFLIRDVPLLPKTQNSDTKRLASRNFSFFSNRLDSLAEVLGLTRKLDHEGWPLWVKVHGRDPLAMFTMSEYCKRDVKSLGDLYHKMRPVDSQAPNHNLHQIGGSKNLCPTCGSTRIESRGYYYTRTRTRRKYQCKDCKSWSTTDYADRNPKTI